MLTRRLQAALCPVSLYVVKLGHGTFGDVAAVAGAPLVVHVEQVRALIDGRVFEEDAYDAAAAFHLRVDLLEGDSRQILRQCARRKR